MTKANAPRWGDLSDEARDILEWIEHVHSGARNEIRIEIGKPVSYAVPGGPTPVADRALAEEIRAFLAGQDAGLPDRIELEEDGQVLKLTSGMPDGSLLVRAGMN